MTGTSWRDRAAAELDRIRAQNRYRVIRELDASSPVDMSVGGDDPVVSFASNDYLGLTAHPDVVAAAHAAIDRWGTGSGAARLIVGARPVHAELEAELADWKRAESALLFSTGYVANLGVLSMFGEADVTIVSDELNHASIVDGCRMAKARVEIYRHCDVDHVVGLVRAARSDGRRVIVVSDTVFSMEGDVAPVDALAEVCASHNALLMLDEAHAVLGPAPNFDPALDVLRVGTLSKTLGALGGFVAGAEALVALVRNRSRSFIFTTASTPADTAAALAALRVLRGVEGRRLVSRLRAHVEKVRPGHPSPIVPIELGDETAAMAASNALLARALLVPAVRPPTVPIGTSRLRIALSAAHTDAQVGALIDALDVLGLRQVAGAHP